MIKIIFTLVASALSFQSFAQQKLPAGHKLLQNEQGEYYVKNKDDIVMIDPAIIALGHEGQWIVACVKNDSIDTDPKRYYFINLRIGGTTDSINQENWEYFKGVYDELENIELKALTEEACP